MLKLIHITKRYHYQKVLDDICMELPDCGLVAIVGPSGCGKSTLLHIMGGIDKDFQGCLEYNGKAVKHHLSRYRRQHMSFIFQDFYLIKWLSVHQNIKLSHFFYPQAKSQQNLDIKTFEDLKIPSLSQGQKQRIAYLRAHYQKADILLCDEPTGSLDPTHAKHVMECLKEESQERLVILVSHNMPLVEKYCDEIYEMNDGHIQSHRIKRIVAKKSLAIHPLYRQYFSKMRLSLMSFLSHKSRSLQLIFGLTLSFLCIVLTLTMSHGLEKQIQDYIYSLVPASSISFQNQQHLSIDQSFVQQLSSHVAITRVQLFLDDYECLGIGFHSERYQESQTLFIGDDASPYLHLQLKLGHYPKEDQDILLSLSTAKHLLKEQDDLSSLINQKIYAWYQYQNQVKAISYRIVGITDQSTTLDTLYQKENAYIHLLKGVYYDDELSVKKTLGLIYVNPQYQRSQIIAQLKKDYPEYQFLEVGATTSKNVTQTMSQVRIVLSIFSVLAIISSLFLIGEVMFLNVVQKKKDLAIMKCFGASSFDLLRIVFYESIEIILIAQLICVFLYWQLLNFVNQFIQNMLLNNTFFFAFDYQLLLLVFGISYGLVIISQLPPLVYVFKMNTVKHLKDSS